MTYETFSVSIEHVKGDFRARVVASPVGESRSAITLNPDVLETARHHQKAWLAAVKRRNATRTSETARALGEALFNTLITDDIHALYQRSLADVETDPERGLRIKLRLDSTSDMASFTSLPWELLYDPGRNEFLNQEKDTPVVRHLNATQPAAPLPFEPPLRILVAMANPKGTRRLNLDRERDIIKSKVANQQGIEVDFIERAGTKTIREKLSSKAYHVFHFMGHGGFFENEGFLILEKENREREVVRGPALGELLRGKDPDRPDHPAMSLVFLNACKTGTQGSGEVVPEQTRPRSRTRLSATTEQTRWGQTAPWASTATGVPWQETVPWMATPEEPTVMPRKARPQPRPTRSALPAERAPWAQRAPWASTSETPLPVLGGDGAAEVPWQQAAPWASTTSGIPQPAFRGEGATDEPGVFSGTASALVMAGLPAVVAMQFAISDSAAIAFARGFYEQLTLGGSVDEAVTIGRKAIIGTATSKRMEWSTPVLFMRAPDGLLFHRKTVPPLLQQFRNLQILLNRVRLFWIEGVLKPSVPGGEPISLHMMTAPGAVDDPLGRLDTEVGNDDTPLPADTTITKVFDEAGSRLLMLGNPGSGKTTTLLALARTLLRRAEATLKAPAIPVVFDLANWSNTHPSLEVWMVKELVQKYQIPANTARTWLQDHHLVLLLDGLDAIEHEHQNACVEAINAYLQETGAGGLAVTCCTDTYAALGVKLSFPNATPDAVTAVRLLPLTPAQIDGYGQQAHPPLTGFKAFLKDNPALREQAQSPLALRLMSEAFGPDASSSGDGLQAQAGPPPEKEALHTNRLLDTYVDRMMARPTESSFPPEDTTRWLGWLSKGMRANHQNIFLIENLKPDWFSNASQRWLSLTVFSVMLGFFLTAILYIALEASVWIDPPMHRSVDPPVSMETHLPPFWFWWLVNTIWMVCVVALDRFQPLGLTRMHKDRLRRFFKQPVQAFIYYELWIVLCLAVMGLFSALGVMDHTPWSAATPWNTTAPWIIGLIIILIYTAHPGKADGYDMLQALGWSWKGAVRGLIIGFNLGFVVWLAYVGYVLAEGWEFTDTFKNLGLYLPLSAVGGFLFNGVKVDFMKGKTTPNQGIRLSIVSARRYALWFGPVIAVVCWIIFVALFAQEQKTLLDKAVWALPGALGFGLIVLLIAGLWFGGKDVLRHISIRMPMRLYGQIPGRRQFIPFLNEAARRGFLQKVGGGYRFIHQTLQDHFAAKQKEAALFGRKDRPAQQPQAGDAYARA